MAGGRAGGLRLAAQLLVHAQPLAEDDAPSLGLVLDRLDLEAGAAQQFCMAVDAGQRRCRHAVPQQLPLCVR